MKRTAFKRKPTKKPARRVVAKKGYQCPDWFMDIKPGAHGSTPAQKRLWRVISEYVRQRDFEKYGGKCISCTTRFSRWQDAQAGHWMPFSICHSWFKYDPLNIHAQCAGCNTALYRSGAHIGHEMGEELKRRYGADVLDRIKADNLSYRGQKMEDWQIVEVVAALRPDLSTS